MTHYSEGRRWSDKWNMWVLDDVQPANGAAPDKQQDLVETLQSALEKLVREAGEVSRLGAVTGSQWTRLAGALISARAALAAANQEDAA